MGKTYFKSYQFISIIREKYSSTCISEPLPVVPKSSTPATSDAKRMHRVQWIHLVMMVLTKGPMSLSSTDLRNGRNEKQIVQYDVNHHYSPFARELNISETGSITSECHTLIL